MNTVYDVRVVISAYFPMETFFLATVWITQKQVFCPT